MNKQGLFAYDKFSVKKDRSDRFVRNTDGTPVLNERLVSSVMLTPVDAKFLNTKWDQFQAYYKEVGVKIEPLKEKEPEVKIVAKIDIPQPPNGAKLMVGLTSEKFIGFTHEEVDAVLPFMSKVSMLKLVNIEIEKKKLAMIKLATVIEMVREKRNELKK